MMTPLDGGSRSMLDVFIACITITTIAVILRLGARWKQHTKLWWDDWLMLIAWAFLMAYIAISIKLTYLGSAQLFTRPATPEIMLMIYKLAFPSAILFETINITVKISILFFYCRVFTIDLIRNQAIILGLVCVAWYIGSLFSTIFQCTPVHKAWDRAIEGHCINLDGFVLGYELTNILLDISLIALPLTMISTLNLRARQKILLSFIFALGGGVCIASILRIVYTYKPKNPTAMLVHSPIWSAISIAAAVVCGNLPMLRPILRLPVSPALLKSWYSSMRSKSRSSNSSKNGQGSEVKDQYDVIDEEANWHMNKQAQGKPSGKDPYPLTSFTVGSITDSRLDGRDSMVVTSVSGGLPSRNV